MSQARSRCTHPLWYYPNPLPAAGEPCPDCGRCYQPPNEQLRVNQQDLDGRRSIEDLRALLELRALDFLTDDKEMTATAAARESQRLIRRRGWSDDRPEQPDAAPGS